MLRQDVIIAQRYFSEKYCVTRPKKVAEMNDYTSKREREDGQYLAPELVSSSHQRLGMGSIASPFSHGRFMEVVPPRQGYPFYDQTALQNTGPTRTLAPSVINNVLSDDQIQSFITSTVLPHHRTLINPNGMKWSHRQPEQRPTQQELRAKVAEWNNTPVYGLKTQGLGQDIPMTSNAAQGTQKTAFIKEMDIHPSSFPTGGNVPKEAQREITLFREGTQDEVYSIPHGFSVSQETKEDIIIITEGTQNETIYIPKGNCVTQNKPELNFITKGSSVSHGTQEFPYIPQRIINSQDEIIWYPKGISTPQGTWRKPTLVQSPHTGGLSDGLNYKGPQTGGTPVPAVTTRDLSAQYQQVALSQHLKPWNQTPQTVHVPSQTEQNLKQTSVNNVQESFTATQTDPASALVSDDRARAAGAHMFKNPEVAHQGTVNQTPQLETLYNQTISSQQIDAELNQILEEFLTESPSTTQQVDKQKQTTDPVTQNQECPDICRKRKRKRCSRGSTMKRQKVDRELENVTSVLKSEPVAGEKVWSEASTDYDDDVEFMNDAIKILQGLSSDVFAESVIDQIFKDTFESDIFLTFGDDFIVDSVFYLSTETEGGLNCL